MRRRTSWPACIRELRADRLVDGERPERHMIADAADSDPGGRVHLARRAAAGAVAAIDTVLLSTFEDGMLSDDVAEIEDTDQIGKLLNLDDPTGAVGHAVIVAADRDEAIVADAPLQLEHRIEAMPGHRLQFGLLCREGLGDDPLGSAVDAHVGDGIEPVDELSVEVVEAAKAAAKKEVLTDIAERPLDLPLRLGPIGSAGAGLKAIMMRQREQRAVVDDVALIVLAGHRGLHAVVEDLDRHAADRLEGLDMTAQQRLQVLVENVAREQEARVSEHQAE